MEEFKKLSDREHMLTRPSMYIGKTVPETIIRFINGKQEHVFVSPALLKISNEIIDNSIDEFIRANHKFATKITISLTSESLKVEDNGRGIPVVKYQGEWRPKVAWCEAKAGTSFSENRVGPGANGVGSVVANVFSSAFIGTTYDGNQYCRVSCYNNMEKIDVQVQKSISRGTIVEIFPDFKRFGVSEYTDDHIKMIEDRINLLSVTYPDIQFIFNGKKIKFKNIASYFDMYGASYVIGSGNNCNFALYPSEHDEYIYRTAIDGLDMVFGGTHENYLMREVSNSLRDMIKKKHKLDISLAEIKRGFLLVFIGHDFPNMEFESQTKEKLSNSEKVVKEWLGNIQIDKLCKSIMNCPDIIDPIIEAKLAKQLALEKRAIALAQKTIAKKHIEKHTEAKSKNKDDTILFLCEGDSAAGMGKKVRDPQKHGFFPLLGMPMNTYQAKQKDMIENKEISSIMSILGLTFNETNPVVINYGRIGLLADCDLDGIGGIVPLLLAFFHHWPSLFTEKRIYIIPSPLYVMTKRTGKTKQIHYFYNLEEYNKEKDKYKGYETRYIKGLATLRDYEYQTVIEDESKWIEVTIDDVDAFNVMFSSNVDARKQIMGE